MFFDDLNMRMSNACMESYIGQCAESFAANKAVYSKIVQSLKLLAHHQVDLIWVPGFQRI